MSKTELIKAVGGEEVGEVSDAKHTPGPWKTSNDPRSGKVLIVAEHPNPVPGEPGLLSRHIATVSTYGPWDENESNARLIAAAPDLLHACREMLNEIRAYNGESEFESGSPVKDWCDMLKKAIEIATGEPK